MIFDEELKPDDMASINSGLKEFESGAIRYHSLDSVKDILNRIWDFGLEDQMVQVKVAPLIEMVEFNMKVDLCPRLPQKQSQPMLFEEPEPEIQPWFFGMSKEFRNAVEKIDRKLQGQILKAIGYLVLDPLKVKGDTIKPLRGKEGLWRYRIGDYRLLYLPDITQRHVVLMSFTARSAGYD